MEKERSANLKISPMRASLTSCGGLLQAVWVGVVFFYGARAAEAIGLVGAVLTCALGGVIAAACVPLVYLAVNRTESRLWGRYHFTLAITVLTSSLLCAALFASQGSESKAGRIVAACLELPLLGSALSATAYVCTSIGNRLAADDGKSGRRKAAANIIGLLIGVALCCLPYTGLSPDSIGYALASLIIASGAIVYFSSVDCLPRFVRPLQKKPTLSAVKEEFFKKPTEKSALSGAAYFLLAFAALTCVGYIATAVKFYEIMSAFSLVCLAAAVVVGTSVYAIAYKRRTGKIAAFVGAAAVAVTAVAATIVLRFAKLSEASVAAIVLFAFVVVGIGAGLSLAGARNTASKFSDGYTAGAAYCLEIMLLLIATAAAVAVCAALSKMPRAADIVFACVTGASSAVAAALIGCAYGRKEKKERQ